MTWLAAPPAQQGPFLPGVPENYVRAVLAAFPGDELGSGKLKVTVQARSGRPLRRAPRTDEYVTTLIGYARVSKADGSQVHDLQRDALVAAGVAAEHIYKDSASGRRYAVVWKLARLGRDVRHLVDLVGDFTKREVGA